MRYEVFAVLDAIAGAFLPPMFMRSRGEAIRSFADACNSSDHQFARHANDYVLFSLGQWDDDTALFIEPRNSVPERLVTGLDVLNKSTSVDMLRTTMDAQSDSVTYKRQS